MKEEEETRKRGESFKRICQIQKRNKGNFQDDGEENFQQSWRAIHIEEGKPSGRFQEQCFQGEKMKLIDSHI